MIPKAIHQFHSGSAFGDAVTNGMLYTKTILNELGFESKIYVEHVASALENEIEHFSKYVSDENNILLLHHSMGHDLDEWIEKLNDKIVLVYHNITPETFFEKDSVFYNYSLKGRTQLELLKEKSIAAIGDSQLNVDELLSRGFDKDNLKVIPLLLDVDKIKSHEWNHDLYDKNSDTFNIVFIGRVAENKCQHEVIEIYNKFREKTNLKTKCFIVGGLSNDNYESNLYDLIGKYDLSDEVIITDKVSSEDLYSYYRLADVFLCMSEHEGFGVPLVESMVFDVPVVAYDSSNIKNTLNGGGILINEKDFDLVADIIYKLSINRAYRREIIYKQREVVKIYENSHIKSELVNFLKSLGVKINHDIKSNSDINRIKYQFEGPFDSSYSLAILNREMASSMNKKYTGAVSLFSTEGGGDFKPNQEFIKNMEDVISMNEKSKKAIRSDVLLRNLYPPRVNDMRGLINMMNSYGWEESSFPKEYIDNFNKHLDALPVMSKYVQKVMKDNGLVIPAPVVGVGIDHMLDIESKKFGLKSKKSFNFLHISSCFPRKGVDVLLEAYCASFTSEDDVCLVIKTFPNPHNDIEEQIIKKQIENEKCPEIELINFDLEDGYIVGLYESCDCLVAPSRGEGYGMPMAEAMLFNMPVITTGYSGQVDFCTDETSWLIDYTFEKAQTHMGLFNSYWANPKVENLSILMKNMINIPLDEKLKKTIKAKQNILENHKWEDCTNRLNNIVKDIENKNADEEKANPKIGWVTTWNSKCGIATYSKFLIDEFSDEVGVSIFANILPQSQLIDSFQELNVQRVWKDGGETDLSNLFNSIVNSKIDTLVIQFNFGFFNLYALENLIKKLDKRNIKIIIEFHSVADVNKEDFKASLSWIKDSLSKIEKLLVHNIDDLNILKTFGLVENVTLFPHGVMESNIDDKIISNKKRELGLEKKFVIASYGFLLPQKGIKELIEAFSIINKQNKDTHLLLINAIYPADKSVIYAKECNSLIYNLELIDHVTMINEFLSDNESLLYLQCSDLIVMPYKETKESASGAARYALSSKKPLLCTPQYIFKDIEDLVHFTKDENVESIASSILVLIKDKEKLNLKLETQNRWIKEHSWFNMNIKLNNIINNIPKDIFYNLNNDSNNLYLDITTIINGDNESVLEKRIKEMVDFLILKDKSKNINLVYRDDEGNIRVTNKYYRNFILDDSIVDFKTGDIYFSLSLDMQLVNHVNYLLFIQLMRKSGVIIKYFIHDISPLISPNAFDNLTVKYFNNWIRFVLLNSDSIICSSNDVYRNLNDFIDFYLDLNHELFNISFLKNIKELSENFN
jgi:glycosyltransferase involved in cell wall biosynthesis